MASSQTGGVKRPASAAALSATDKKARNDDGDHKYMSGFGNEFATEALEGALPVGQNSPQVCPYGLYAEQLSGTAFTAPRSANQRSWLYRVRPTVIHAPLTKVDDFGLFKSDFEAETADPNQMRWQPPKVPESSTTFLQGISSMCGAGGPSLKTGLGVHLYTANASMGKTAFYNSDGDFLIVPQQGTLEIRTEMGRLRVAPHEICVIPRGIRYSVDVQGPSRGYICELFQGHFELPNLGPIGANGLANARDFLYPVADYVDEDEEWQLFNKYGGNMYTTTVKHCPFNVVAWHGNYAPYKYNLDNFNCMNSVTYDHPDPSIYTVLTAPTDTPGVAACDFVIFPPRWMVMNKTFRPPYYHRNCMSEYMGMVYGKYDAKVGFVPGGSSLHSCMTPHGPDAATFYKASGEELNPVHFDKGLAFMFESTYMLKLTQSALEAPERDLEYYKCWQQLPKVFDPTKREVIVEVPAAAAEGAAGK